MSQAAPSDPAAYLLEVRNSLGAFSQFLAAQRDMGNTGLGLGDETARRLTNLGQAAPQPAPTRQEVTPRARSQAPKPGPAPDTAFFCQGPERASVYFVDQEGEFFNGPAGALLKKIIGAMSLSPEQICICNTAHRPTLMEKIRANSPNVVVSLGDQATRHLLQTREDIRKHRGKFTFLANARIMPTRHPRELLESPGLKREVWESMKQVMAALGNDHGG